jgi:hypothetical protein
MVMPGETVATGASTYCRDCDAHMSPKVCHSAAGYYVGYECQCGPYSRESDYFKTRELAQKALDNDDYCR